MAMALIEIDGLPVNSMVIFHGKLLNNQMVIPPFEESHPFETTESKQIRFTVHRTKKKHDQL